MTQRGWIDPQHVDDLGARADEFTSTADVTMGLVLPPSSFMFLQGVIITMSRWRVISLMSNRVRWILGMKAFPSLRQNSADLSRPWNAKAMAALMLACGG